MPILFLLVTLLFLGVNVSAANTQGLSWGVLVGDRIDYTLSVYSEGYETTYLTNGTFDCYVTIKSLPDIPATVNTIPNLQPQNYNQSFLNGTEYAFAWIAVPIGNWTLFTEILEQSMTSFDNVTFIDTATEWGYDAFLRFLSSNLTQILRVSKSDGAMNYLRHVQSWTSGISYYRTEMIRKGLLGPWSVPQTISIVITVASIGIIVNFGVMIIRQKSRTSFS